MSATHLPLSEPPAAVSNHLLALTGLRIFPALAVYFSHVKPPVGAPDWLTRSLTSGYYGVTVFFVLSGFVLAINYWDRLARPSARGVWSFAVARFARVYPLYLLAIAYIACKSYVVTGAVPLSLPWHILGLQAWLPDLVDAFAFGPSWSISVEVFLYASLPVLALSLRRLVTVRRLVVATVLTIVVMVLLAWWFQYAGRATLAATDAGSAHHWLYRMPLTRLGDFLLGIFAARIYVNVRERPHMDKAGAILAAVGLLSLLFFTTQFWLSTSAFRWDVAYAVPSDLLILGVALSPTAALARFLALPAIVLLGEASYAFYLIHATVAEPLGAGAWAVRVTAGTLSLEAMILGLILAMAIGIHIGVERPSRVWIRRMLDHGRPPAARTPLLRYYG